LSASYHADDLDPILGLIRRIVKAERVEIFLRKAKSVNSDIKSTGGLDELVFQSLREAVRSRAATVDDVLGCFSMRKNLASRISSCSARRLSTTESP
jgi:hypothetical protein